MERAMDVVQDESAWQAGFAHKMLISGRDGLEAVAKYAFDYNAKHARETSVSADGWKMPPGERTLANKGLTKNTGTNFLGAAAVGAVGVAIIAPLSLGAIAAGAMVLGVAGAAMGGRIGYEAVQAAVFGVGAAAWAGKYALMGVDNVADVLGGLAGRLLGRRAGRAAGSEQSVALAGAEMAAAPEASESTAGPAAMGEAGAVRPSVAEGGGGGTYAEHAPEPTGEERRRAQDSKAKMEEKNALALGDASLGEDRERKIRASNDRMLDYSRGAAAAKGGQSAGGAPTAEEAGVALALQREAARREKALAALGERARLAGVSEKALAASEAEAALKLCAQSVGKGGFAALAKQMPLANSKEKSSGLVM